MFLFLLQKTKTKVKEAGEKKRKRDKVTGFISFHFVSFTCVKAWNKLKKAPRVAKATNRQRKKAMEGEGGRDAKTMGSQTAAMMRA